jgi:hypothetical protein
MKTTIKLFGFMVTVAIITFSMAGCEQPDDPAGHTHQWGAWEVTTAATCIAKGVETQTCALDATHKETRDIAIDPNAHNYQNYAQTTAPTCLLDGEEQAACTRDNTHTKGTRPITALGHDWEDWSEADVIIKLQPTCTTAGNGNRACLRNGCDEEDTAEGNIPALGHDYNYTETTAPTCTTAGIETGTCTRDQVTTTRTGAAALGHDYQNYTETTAPTCSAVGKEEAPCTRDSNHVKDIRDIPINPTAHNIAVGTYLCSACNNPYELGDTGPGGGKIFYVSTEGFTMTDDNTTAHYLEAAPADMESGLL